MLCYSDKGNILKQLDKFVITNMIFFGTAKEKDIFKKIDRIKCAKQTLKLLEILKPKVVVLLGKECRRLFKIVTKCKQMESITSDNTVFYCYYNDCHIISVYHTAYYKYYSKDKNKEKIGKIIGSLLDNPINVRHDIESKILY
jgi:uracil-DNA glycosylase